MMDYNALTEEELIDLIREDKNSPALDVMISKYKGYINSLLAKYHVKENDFPEFFADASIGLYSAIAHFDFKRGVPFEPYAKLCVKRAVFNSLKKYLRAKNSDLTECLYIEELSENFPKKALELYCEYGDPQSMYLQKEELGEFFRKAEGMLTPFEWKVFTLYIENMSYAQIAGKTGHNIKSISNAVYRIRNKLSVINYMKN